MTATHSEIVSHHDKVLIVDFGSQVTQLIARRVREAGVYCEIAPFQSAQAAFDEIRGDETVPGKAVQSDAEIDAFVRRTGASIYHPVGTCRMGRDALAVVDEELRVRGIDRLEHRRNTGAFQHVVHPVASMDIPVEVERL